MPPRAYDSLCARLRDAESKSDFVLLVHNCHFIPKKLLRDAIRDASARQRGDLIVDVGCGFQPYRQFLQGYQNYVGIDQDGSRKPNIIASVKALPLANSCVDAVLCTEVIEHIEDPGEVVGEIARLLRPGGLLMLTAPMSWSLHYEPFDYFRFTCYGLEKLARDAGLNVVQTRRLGGLFALVGARLADVFHRRIYTLIPVPVIRRLAATAVAIPINIVFYSLSCVADGLDQRDAIGWMIMAIKDAGSEVHSD